MPSVSRKQHNFMEAASHNASFARRARISQRVAQEFVAADQAQRPPKKKRSPIRHSVTIPRISIPRLM